MRRAVGIFFFLGLVLLGLLSLWVDDEMSVFHRAGSYYFVVLKSADGLQEGNAVWLAGTQAGRVTRIEMTDQDVRVHFFLRRGLRLRRDSVASLPTASLLGNSRSLALTLGSPASEFLAASPTLPGVQVTNVRPVTGLDTLIEKADELFGSIKDSGPAIKEAAESVRNIARKIEKGEGTIGKLVNDPKLYNDLLAAVGKLDEGLTSFRSISAKLEKGEGTLGKLLNDPKMYEELTGAVAKLNQGMESFRNIAGKIEKGEGTIGKLVNDDKLYKDLADASKGIADLARKINSGEGTVGKLVADPALYDELKGAAASLASVMRKIDEGHGTLGRLVADDTLYREATRLMREAREAVEDAREQAPLSTFGTLLFAAFQ
jgi:phospholipid/cholesterol/gamma-HCH transport system substrate-binding protein